MGAPIEFTAPAAPTGVVTTANPESVRLTWTASPDNDLAGYNVYRAESANGPFNTIARAMPGTAFIDNTATLTGQYYYKIKAVDKSLNRSAYSTQVAASTTGTKDLVAQLAFESSTLDNSQNLNRGAAYGSVSYAAGKVGSSAISLNGTDAFVQLPATLANKQGANSSRLGLFQRRQRLAAHLRLRQRPDAVPVSDPEKRRGQPALRHQKRRC